MTVRRHRYTYREYLEHDDASSTKHEFLEGEIYAMAGGTPLHAALSSAVNVALANQLEPSRCRTYSSDLRVRVLATDLATYPDVTVVCGPLETDPSSPVTVTNPTVIVEVLSDSTEAYDQGEKLDHYKQIESLRAVVLVSQRERFIEVWSRATTGWVRSEARPGEQAVIEAIDCRLAVTPLYDAAGAP